MKLRVCFKDHYPCRAETCGEYDVCKVRLAKENYTNEEWFDSLTTEKKAKIIKMVINICISCKEHKTVRTRGCLLRQKMAKDLLFLPCMDENGICGWLKQPHTFK